MLQLHHNIFHRILSIQLHKTFLIINLALNKCKKSSYLFIFHAYVCTFVNLFDILWVLNDYEKIIGRLYNNTLYFYIRENCKMYEIPFVK